MLHSCSCQLPLLWHFRLLARAGGIVVLQALVDRPAIGQFELSQPLVLREFPAVLGARALMEKIVIQLDAGKPLDQLPDLRDWQRELLTSRREEGVRVPP